MFLSLCRQVAKWRCKTCKPYFAEQVKPFLFILKLPRTGMFVTLGKQNYEQNLKEKEKSREPGDRKRS